MSDFGTPPTIPTELQIYNSYVEDPKWQTKFSIIWATATAVAIVASLPHLWRGIRTGNTFRGLFGISEDFTPNAPYTSIATSKGVVKPTRSRRNFVLVFAEWGLSALRWTVPGAELDVGQMLVIIGYLVSVLVCLTMGVDLISNSNRGGFLALAQFPVVFLFATKNNILSLLLGPGNGYEKLNYVHRWAGRGLFITATIHGSLWIRNHLQYDIAIIGQQKETSGIAAFGVLCVIVLTSLRPLRRLFYQFFWITHVLGFVAFFITICYHTPYAAPWIFPPLAFYGLDLLMRMLRYRIKDATLVPVDQNMTLIHIHDCDDGWQAGQHVRLRVFFNGRLLESHPLTVLTAPPSTSCVGTGTLALAARAQGDWTRALNEYARHEQERLPLGQGEKHCAPGVPVQVMFDGAYGGCSIDLGGYESVMLVAGGSGATFTLGLLDDIVGRCVRLGRAGGEKTRRIEFVWCIRSFGCIEWFAPMLTELANAVAGTSLDLHVSIYVTCLCNPEAVPPIPNSDVSTFRPSVAALLRDLVTPPSPSPSPSADVVPSSKASSAEDDDAEDAQKGLAGKLEWVGLGGGVAVCASGPESLIRETQNAVARMGVVRGIELGGIGLHTELFAL